MCRIYISYSPNLKDRWTKLLLLIGMVCLASDKNIFIRLSHKAMEVGLEML